MVLPAQMLTFVQRKNFKQPANNTQGQTDDDNTPAHITRTKGDQKIQQTISSYGADSG